MVMCYKCLSADVTGESGAIKVLRSSQEETEQETSKVHKLYVSTLGPKSAYTMKKYGDLFRMLKTIETLY